MDSYYFQNGAEWIGPISKEKLVEFVRKGIVDKSTVVSVSGKSSQSAKELFGEQWVKLAPRIDETAKAELKQAKSVAEPRKKQNPSRSGSPTPPPPGSRPSNFINCPHCGVQVFRSAKTCPQCANQIPIAGLPSVEINTKEKGRRRSSKTDFSKNKTKNKTSLFKVVVVLLVVYFSFATYVYVNDIELWEVPLEKLTDEQLDSLIYSALREKQSRNR